jgi:two-component system, sensor histidine kinase
MLEAGDLERGIEILTKIREELGQEADSLRRLMSGLRPPVLEERGLVPALRDMLGRFGAENGIHTSLQGTIVHPVPDDLETLAFRVVQESLTNAAKHAQASSIAVQVTSDPTQLRVEIQDDGVGFETGRQRDFLRAGRAGLAGMKERVELASGIFMVRSAPGRGTTIMAALPIEATLVTRDLMPDDAENARA